MSWEVIRAKGKSHFVWTNGVLGVGLVSFLFFYFELNGIEWPSRTATPRPEAFVQATPLVQTLIAIPVFALFGYIAGALMWYFTNRHYEDSELEDPRR